MLTIFILVNIKIIRSCLYKLANDMNNLMLNLHNIIVVVDSSSNNIDYYTWQ